MKKHDVPGIIASLEKIEREARKLYNSTPDGEDENGFAKTWVHKYLALISNGATECRVLLSNGATECKVLFSQIDEADYSKYNYMKEVPEEQRKDFMTNVIFTAYEIQFGKLVDSLKSASMDSGKIISSKSLDDAIDDYMQFKPE